LAVGEAAAIALVASALIVALLKRLVCGGRSGRGGAG
jgi:hypothetical protein